jgi:hypothetical protein
MPQRLAARRPNFVWINVEGLQPTPDQGKVQQQTLPLAAREVHLISRSLIRFQKYLTARQHALHPCKAFQFDGPYLSLIS